MAVFRAGVAIACAPIVISVAWAIRHRQWPAGDRSIMGVFTQDVFTRHTPLVGTVSTMGNYSEHLDAKSVHHLGPAQFWALSIPNWLTGGRPVGMLLGALLVNCGAVVLVAVFVRRRLGTTAATGAVLMCTVLAYGLGPSMLRDVWTPFLGLWPLLALGVLTWSLLDGDARALPWAALVSGFLAQIELMFVAPAAVLSAAGVIGFALRRRADRQAADAVARPSDAEADAEAGTGTQASGNGAPRSAGLRAPARPAPLGWVLIRCQLIALAMWWPVAYQELTGKPGNLTLLIRALRHPGDKAGAAFVRHNVVAQLALPPVWIRRATSPFQIGQSPSVVAVVSAVAFAALLVVVTVAAWHRRHQAPTVLALLLTTYPVLLAGLVNLEITPAGGTIGLQYRRWLWPFGAFLWFAVIVGVVSWAAERSWASAVRARIEAKQLAAGVATLALATVVVIPASLGQLTPPSDDVRINPLVQSMWGPLHRRLDKRSTYLAVDGADAAFGLGPEIMRRLVVDGFTMRTSTFGADSYGDQRVLSADRPAAQTLELVTGKVTLAPPDLPVTVLAAGRRDGSSAEEYVTLANRLVVRLRGGAGFQLTAAGLRKLHEQLLEDGDRPLQKTLDMLADPTRAMFDVTLLRLQVAGQTTRSPLSDDEARQLLAGLRPVGALAFLRGAPKVPSA
ncbi:MAG: hypothetical protein JWM89_2899 [Acidimicrobiales bacterium]|nr:hypothetical protein [Acidimicrobiales bacterium]